VNRAMRERAHPHEQRDNAAGAPLFERASGGNNGEAMGK
jgi:hypothetical protein